MEGEGDPQISLQCERPTNNDTRKLSHPLHSPARSILPFVPSQSLRPVTVVGEQGWAVAGPPPSAFPLPHPLRYCQDWASPTSHLHTSGWRSLGPARALSAHPRAPQNHPKVRPHRGQHKHKAEDSGNPPLFLGARVRQLSV